MKTGLLLIGGLGWLSAMASSQTLTGNTVCKGGAMDWYTLTMKETPCRTYERLRQMCNSTYTVGTQTVRGSTLKGAPDACVDQNPACCCNYIAFALSMLCLNCQQDVGSLLGGEEGGARLDTGYIAGPGSFQLYLTNFDQSPSCTPQLNTSFPHNIQQQVCLEGLNIDDNLYSTNNFSPDGSWMSTNVMRNMQQSMASSNYTFNKCNDLNFKATIAASSLSPIPDFPPTLFSAGLSWPSASPTTSPTTSRARFSLPIGAIIAISVVATLGVCITVVLLAYLFWRRRAKRRRADLSQCLIEEPSAVMDRNAGIIHQFELPPSSYINRVSADLAADQCHEQVQNPIGEMTVVSSAPNEPPSTFVSRSQDSDPTPGPLEENTRARRQRIKHSPGALDARESPDNADTPENQDGRLVFESPVHVTAGNRRSWWGRDWTAVAGHLDF